MRKPVLGPERRTNPLIWCAAIICTLLTIAVIITGMVVFIGYMVIRPKVPQMSVVSAHLDKFAYDTASVLVVKVSIVIKAENDNSKARASFYETSYTLTFHGVKIAYLNADPFDVASNSSIDLYYPVESSPIPLKPEEGEVAELFLRRGQVVFDIRGNTRTRWRVGILGSVKFWLHLNCQLKFPLNGTIIYPRCSTKSK